MIGLTYIRNLYNKSLQDIADELGLTKQTVHKWETKQKQIPKIRLEQLSEMFDLNQDYFNKELNNRDKIIILSNEIDRLEYMENFERKSGDARNYTNKELVNLYKKMSNSLGRPATYDELLRCSGIWSSRTIRERFGGIDGLRKLAGLKTSSEIREYDKDVVKDTIINKCRELNRRLDKYEFNNDNNLPSMQVAKRLFNVNTLHELWNVIENEL